jgi:hypothetical protein
MVAVPAALLVAPSPALGDEPRRSEALEWVLGQLRPGDFIVMQYDDASRAEKFIADVLRVAGNRVVFPGRSPVHMKQEALRTGRTALIGTSQPYDIGWQHEWNFFRIADVVVYLHDGKMDVVKHRSEWDHPTMSA